MGSFYLCKCIKLKKILFRLLLFLNENLGACFKESVSESIYYFTPCMIVVFEGYLMSYTVSYELERAVILLLINFTLANVTLNLMLSNMAKKPFSLM